mgnify:CR=1 FL=1
MPLPPLELAVLLYLHTPKTAVQFPVQAFDCEFNLLLLVKEAAMLYL